MNPRYLTNIEQLQIQRWNFFNNNKAGIWKSCLNLEYFGGHTGKEQEKVASGQKGKIHTNTIDPVLLVLTGSFKKSKS